MLYVIATMLTWTLKQSINSGNILVNIYKLGQRFTTDNTRFNKVLPSALFPLIGWNRLRDFFFFFFVKRMRTTHSAVGRSRAPRGAKQRRSPPGCREAVPGWAAWESQASGASPSGGEPRKDSLPGAPAGKRRASRRFLRRARLPPGPLPVGCRAAQPGPAWNGPCAARGGN